MDNIECFLSGRTSPGGWINSNQILFMDLSWIQTQLLKGKTESGAAFSAASPPRGWQLCFSHSPVPKGLPSTSSGNNNPPYLTMVVVIMQHNLSIWLIQIYLNHSLGGVRSVYEQIGQSGTGTRMWAGWELFSQSSRRTLEQNVYCRWKCWSITRRVDLRFSAGQ